jgi:hypothetical protein
MSPWAPSDVASLGLILGANRTHLEYAATSLFDPFRTWAATHEQRLRLKLHLVVTNCGCVRPLDLVICCCRLPKAIGESR